MSTKNKLITQKMFDDYKAEQQNKFRRFVVFVVILCLTLCGITGVASYTLAANQVGYTARDTSWTVDNTQDAIDELRDTVGYALVGSIFSYMGTSAPFGYLPCDGTVYNISDYPRLAEHIKNHFGASNHFGGDGETTFAVPDLRGEFLRGTGTNSHANQGSGLSVGTHQDATNHINFGTTYYDINWPGGNQTTGTGNNYDTTHTWSVGTYSGRGATDGNWYNNRFFTSRPTNTSVLYIIKY